MGRQVCHISKLGHNPLSFGELISNLNETCNIFIGLDRTDAGMIFPKSRVCRTTDHLKM